MKHRFIDAKKKSISVKQNETKHYFTFKKVNLVLCYTDLLTVHTGHPMKTSGAL